MEDIIKTIIKLNIQLEGAMRVALNRPSPEVLEAAKEIYDRLGDAFSGLHIEDQPSHELKTVKEEEAEGAEEAPLQEPTETQMGVGTVVYDDAEATQYAMEESAAENSKAHEANSEQRPEQVASGAGIKTVTADDIRRSLTLNDKFLFRRELFNDSDAEFNDTLDLIASMHSLEEVREYLIDDLQWDPENSAVADFLAIVENIFNSK